MNHNCVVTSLKRSILPSKAKQVPEEETFIRNSYRLRFYGQTFYILFQLWIVFFGCFAGDDGDDGGFHLSSPLPVVVVFANPFSLLRFEI